MKPSFKKANQIGDFFCLVALFDFGQDDEVEEMKGIMKAKQRLPAIAGLPFFL